MLSSVAQSDERPRLPFLRRPLGVFFLRPVLAQLFPAGLSPKEDDMAELRGNLLIGGNDAQKPLGQHERGGAVQGEHWGGELFIDKDQRQFLETERPYRLELEDGRAGKIVITRFENVSGQQNLHAAFKGLSSFEDQRLSPAWDEPVHAGR